MRISSAPASLQFALNMDNGILVPFGIADFNGKPQAAFMTFSYMLDKPADEISLEIKNASGQLLYQYTEKNPVWQPGPGRICWDGFNGQGIYESRNFDGQLLYARFGLNRKNSWIYQELRFGTRYKDVEWLDVRIDRIQKQINVKLRTCFQDLGSLGTFQRQTKTYFELIALAREGVSQYWSRSIQLQDKSGYEVYLETENTCSRAIPSPGIVYNSGGRLRRSRNWELSRILYYNTGKLKFRGQWITLKEHDAITDFKHIAAHEIGHEILLAYGGHLYSKGHKGSSTIVTQTVKGNFLYPPKGEIDLMVYYAEDLAHPYPPDYYTRSIASEKDVLSLLWLSKIEYFLV